MQTQGKHSLCGLLFSFTIVPGVQQIALACHDRNNHTDEGVERLAAEKGW